MEDVKTKSHILANEENTKKSICESRKIFMNNDSNMNYGIVLKKNIHDDGEKIVCKRKRPRICINSEDEDETNMKLKLPVTETVKESTKQITKELPKKNNKKSVTRDIIVKPLDSKVRLHNAHSAIYNIMN